MVVIVLRGEIVSSVDSNNVGWLDIESYKSGILTTTEQNNLRYFECKSNAVQVERKTQANIFSNNILCIILQSLNFLNIQKEK